MFIADIPTLENDLAGCAEPIVLAVRLAGDGGLYVVERVKRGIYSLSRLARWVQEGDVVVAVKGWQPRATDMGMDIETEDKPWAPSDAQNWWKSAQIEEPPSDLGLGEMLGDLQVDVVFGQSVPEGSPDEPSFVGVMEHRSQSLAPVSKEANDEVAASFGPSESQFGAEAMDVDGVAAPNTADVKQSPEELLSGMRDHYLQALYVSKVSSPDWLYMECCV